MHDGGACVHVAKKRGMALRIELTFATSSTEYSVSGNEVYGFIVVGSGDGGGEDDGGG